MNISFEIDDCKYIVSVCSVIYAPDTTFYTFSEQISLTPWQPFDYWAGITVFNPKSTCPQGGAYLVRKDDPEFCTDTPSINNVEFVR